MNVSRGDVVLVDYPYSDRSGSKVRPTLVLSTDELHTSGDAVIAAVTSVVRPTLKSSELFINASKPDIRSSGRLSNSVVECWNVLTIDQRFIVRRIGRLSGGPMRKIDACVKAAAG